MKCVCPMGGDRTCPDDCPLAVWEGLSKTDRKAQRKPVAEKLYKQGFTMDQIATQLGVSQKTISKDLDGVYTEGINSTRSSKRGRKGEGRPKGRKRKEPGVEQTQRAINATPEDWERFKNDALKEGYESAAEKLGALVAGPSITPDMLSLTAQQKNDTWRRQELRRMEQQFEARVQEEIKQQLDHIVLPVWRKKIAEAKKIYDVRRAITNRETFNLIIKCLHTDTRKHIGDDIANEAFTRFLALEKYLLNEKESPTKFTGVPTTPAEWEQRKQEATALRRVKRGHTNVASART